MSTPTSASRAAHGPAAGEDAAMAERAVADALDATRPDLAGAYRDLLPAARAGVMGRLWGALWRERVPGATRRRVRGSEFSLELDGGRRVVAPPALTEPFGPHRAGSPVHLRGPDGDTAAVSHPVDLLTALGLPDVDGRVGTLAAEVAGSVANLALALVAEERRRAGLVATGARGALHLALHGARRDAGFDALAFFEQAVVEGHPLHPCCRTRTGMTPDDLQACAPEWGPTVPLAVVAVRRDRYAGRGELTLLLRAEHPGVAAAADASLPDPDRYALLPVHPWQLRNVLPSRLADAAGGGLTVLPDVGIAAHPLMSLRTLAPVGAAPACHLKTAVDVQMTSAVRTVSPAAVHNGPLLSVLLTDVLRREGGFAGRLRVLCEPATGCYVDPADGPSRSLAAVAREPIQRYVGPGEVPLPVAALPARSPVDGQPLVAEALRLAATTPVTWLAAYCRLVLPPLLTLLTRWGVALEAHGQNTVVVLRDGWPVRVLYRDLGGIRVSPRRLARHGLSLPPLHGDIPTDDPDELHTKLAASLLSTQVAELVAMLARCTGCDQETLWETVAASARKVYAGLAGEQATAADERAFFADTLPVKAMLSMRLSADPLADLWSAVPNPMSGLR